MGGKLSRLKKRNKRNATVEQPTDDNSEEGDHDYESLDGFMIAVDEQSLKTVTSEDSAFVDNSLTTSENTLPTSHCYSAQLSNPYCDYRTLPSNSSRKNTSAKRRSRSKQPRVSPLRRPLTNELPPSIPRDEIDAIGDVESQQWLPREDTEWSHDDASRLVDDSDLYNTYFRRADVCRDVTALKELAPYSSEQGCCTDEYVDWIQYMVEAFQPLIEGSVNVTDVVPYMTFIDEPEEILNKDKESPKKAVALLITKIKESETPGKWQTFLQALERAEYVYIADLIKGETERDNTLNRQLLKVFTPALVDRMDPLHFIDLLYEKSVISGTDHEDIRREKTNRNTRAASMLLLSRIPRKLPNWTEVFIEVLQKSGLQEFVSAFQEINEPVKGCTSLAVTGMKSTADSDEEFYITPVLEAQPHVPARLRHSVVPEEEPHCMGKPTSTFSAYIEHQPRDELDSEIERLHMKKAELEREVSKIRQKKMLETEILALEKERLGLVQSGKTPVEDDISATSPDDSDVDGDVINPTPDSNSDTVDGVENLPETDNNIAPDTICLADILREIFLLKTGVDSLKHHFTAEIEKLQTETEPTLCADAVGYSYASSNLFRDTPVNLYDTSRHWNAQYVPLRMTTLPKAHGTSPYLAYDGDSAFCSYVTQFTV